MVEAYYFRDINIANLNKSEDEFLSDKKARFDLNLQAIDLKIVAFYKTYNL